MNTKIYAIINGILGRKKKITRTSRQKEHMTKGKKKKGRLSSDFSTVSLYARRKWTGIFRVLWERKCEPRILYLTKATFKKVPTVTYMQEFRDC